MTAPTPSNQQRAADWLAKEYGEFLPDASDGYWEFQARELLEALDDAEAEARGRAEAGARYVQLAGSIEDGWQPNADRIADAIHHIATDLTAPADRSAS